MKELGLDTTENTRVLVKGYSFLSLLVLGLEVSTMLQLTPNTFLFWLFILFWTWFMAYLGAVWFSDQIKSIVSKTPIF